MKLRPYCANYARSGRLDAVCVRQADVGEGGGCRVEGGTTPPCSVNVGIRCLYAGNRILDAMSGPELFGYREACHEGLERMFVDICPPVRVAADLGLQPIDIPELGRGRVGVEQIVDA